MFGALLMPQGVGLLTCGTALLSMKRNRKQPRDEEDPEPNPDPPACAGYGATAHEGKRQMLGVMAQNRCEELKLPTMSHGSPGASVKRGAYVKRGRAATGKRRLFHGTHVPQIGTLGTTKVLHSQC